VRVIVPTPHVTVRFLSLSISTKIQCFNLGLSKLIIILLLYFVVTEISVSNILVSGESTVVDLCVSLFFSRIDTLIMILL
jgi:hypothetical protein